MITPRATAIVVDRKWTSWLRRFEFIGSFLFLQFGEAFVIFLVLCSHLLIAFFFPLRFLLIGFLPFLAFGLLGECSIVFDLLGEHGVGFGGDVVECVEGVGNGDFVILRCSGLSSNRSTSSSSRRSIALPALAVFSTIIKYAGGISGRTLASTNSRLTESRLHCEWSRMALFLCPPL